MIGLDRKEKVVVSGNRVGRACGEVGKQSGLNETYSSSTSRLFIYHWGTWWLVIRFLIGVRFLVKVQTQLHDLVQPDC